MRTLNQLKNKPAILSIGMLLLMLPAMAQQPANLVKMLLYAYGFRSLHLNRAG
jgi:hypothetical protein